jgi:HPt (histidine-containing phosphotransfer) domain-containing protein
VGGSKRVTVVIDRELEEIIPGYLRNRRKDLILIPQALVADDFDAIQVLGHRMKGSGAGYGFNQISEIGQKLEDAAKGSDPGQIAEQVAELSSYMDCIDIVFEES